MTKPDKKLTTKQVIIKTTSLTKGIDNSVNVIERERAKIETNLSQINTIIGGLANGELAKIHKDAKDAKDAKEVKEPKSVKKAVAVAKAKDPVKKAVAKKATTAPVKPKVETKVVSNRPSLVEAISEVLKTNGKMIAIEAKKIAVEKYGEWSNQAFYNMLKKDNGKVFKRDGNMIDLIGSRTPVKKSENKEVDEFVAKVASDESVSTVV